MITERLRTQLEEDDDLAARLQKTVKKEWKAPKKDKWARINLFRSKPHPHPINFQSKVTTNFVYIIYSRAAFPLITCLTAAPL
jgi:hypothetical protein